VLYRWHAIYTVLYEDDWNNEMGKCGSGGDPFDGIVITS
jgi:hypothetical protein